MSDLNMSHGKMPVSVSFPLFGFTLVIKLRNSNSESHSNTLVYIDKKKDMLSDLNRCHGKKPVFVSFPLLGFTLVIKLRNSDFESH